jgi:hypothetical protein
MAISLHNLQNEQITLIRGKGSGEERLSLLVRSLELRQGADGFSSLTVDCVIERWGWEAEGVPPVTVRLARAVLDGDKDAAVLLADAVREEWLARVEASS